MEQSNQDIIQVGVAWGVWEQFLKPNPGIIGWGLTLGVAGAYDVWAVKSGKETMSHAFHRGYEHPIMKFLCVGGLGVLALHLAHGPKDTTL